MQQTVVVAMSGGVDSSAAALLLKEEGYRVLGVTLRMLPPAFEPEGPGAPDSAGSARETAGILGIPHFALDCSREFEEGVLGPFTEAYLCGRTPNPCILCNREIKFGLLWEKARALGADFLATGHHARAVLREGVPRIRRAADGSKDQSYALFPLTEDQRGRTLFPVGHLKKEEVRGLAREAGLPSASRAESQDCCFIPGGDYAAFLDSRGAASPPGALRHVDGSVLGRHAGIHRFTVGQRRGIGVPGPEPLYVVRLDSRTHEVWVGPKAFLNVPAFRAAGWTWHAPKGRRPSEALIQTRYRQEPAPARMVEEEGGMLVTWVEEPRTVTPGQAAVAYEGDLLVGGGWILGPEPARPS